MTDNYSDLLTGLKAKEQNPASDCFSPLGHQVVEAGDILEAETLLNSMISKVNRALVRRGADNRFVTFFFVILDAEGTCTYVNAGHNPPYLRGRDGSMRKRIRIYYAV